MRLSLITQSAFAVGLLVALPVVASANEELLKMQQNSKDWVMPNGNYSSTRYSELKQITKENVKHLQPVWTFSTGVLRGHEGGPLVIGDVMYVHTPFPNIVYALDLNEPGKVIWKYEPKQDPDTIPVMCCDTVNRGVAYADGKIFLHQADTTLVALDAKTGQEVWKVQNGDPKKGETGTSAPLRDQGQGHRRHQRRRVRRPRQRDRLQHQGRQARCGGPIRWDRIPTRLISADTTSTRQAGRQGLRHGHLARRPVEDRRRHHLGLVFLRSRA